MAVPILGNNNSLSGNSIQTGSKMGSISNQVKAKAQKDAFKNGNTNYSGYANAGTAVANGVSGAMQMRGGKVVTPSMSQQAVGSIPVFGQLIAAGSQMTQSIAENSIGRDAYGVSKDQGNQRWLSGIGASTDPLGALSDPDAGIEGIATNLLLPFKYGADKSDKENAKAMKAKAWAGMEQINQNNMVGKYSQMANQNTNVTSDNFKNGGVVKPTIPNSLPIRNPRPTLARAFGDGGRIKMSTTQPLAGGELKQISSDTQLASGNTHEQKNALGDGGITLADNKSVIENKELKVDKGDADLIISNNTALPNPYDKNKTFAQSYTVFAKKSGKLEDSKKMIDKNNLTLINRKRLMLEQMQQIMNGNSQGELV